MTEYFLNVLHMVKVILWQYDYTGGPDYQVIFLLKLMLVNKDFLAWLLIGWRLCCQPIRRHVLKSLWTSMAYNREIV